MLSVLVADAFLALPSRVITLANTPLPYKQSFTRAMVRAGTNSTGVTASTLIHTNIARGMTIVIETGDDKVTLAWIIIGIIFVSFITISLVVRCIMMVDWPWLWGKVPNNTSNGVRELELGLSGSEQVASTNSEILQSDGQPYMNKNMVGSTQ
ncbi:hypothetical protein F4679DRAFT_584428 [Xylaria curta]|nr:hypothetical protein F4679DRAFT_584428 [Xylaria curta]